MQPRALQWLPEPRPRARILWLAVADGRGHLMRAQLMRELLARTGIEVELVTTSPAGAAFVGAFGAPCEVLSREFGVVFDGQQNLRRTRTALRSAAYLLSPARCWRDLRWLERRARDAALVINDSFHPALLVEALRAGPMRSRLVQVYGASLRRAVEHQYGGRGWHTDAFRAALDRSYARIEHTFDDAIGAGPRTIRLPPLHALPRRGPAEVRSALGVPAGGRLAVVYLNPYFHDPALAAAIERPLADAGYTVHAVGEGFAGRPGWRARDPALVEAVAAADLFVSAPGMAALGQVRTFGVPFLALATAQPEQQVNLAALAGTHHRVVDAGPALAPRLAAAIAALGDARPRPDPRQTIRRIQARWVDALTNLCDRKERA